jgi:hypothetical protein
MSTRARIAIENDDGSFTSIYTHWDGYVGHHGPILLNHYSKTPLVRKTRRAKSAPPTVATAASPTARPKPAPTCSRWLS